MILKLHEQTFHHSISDSADHHHEDTAAFQEKFVKHVAKLECVIREDGNPFLATSDDLVKLITGVVAPTLAAENVLKIEEIGKSQYKEYCEKCLNGDMSI